MENYGINRLLTEEELQKLTSTDGIIELLCGIEGFKSEDYDQLDEETRDLIDYTMNINLISNSQIDTNLRRSFDAGNIALLNRSILTALSLLYFGEKDENGKYVKYICPYTGQEYDLEEMMREKNKQYSERDLEKVLELEHIIPHSSGGGTVLFNCIPASRNANSVSEKGNLHLLNWLTNPESSGKRYYSAERLDKLIKYILSAYQISFKQYEESELEFEYEQAENEQDDIEQSIVDDKLENPEKASKSNKNIRQTQIEGYIPFCLQLIEKLNSEGYNTEELEERLSKISKNINIDKYKAVQNVIEELFKVEDSKSYLTYGLSIDYVKLVNSIDTNNPDEIKETIIQRFNQIKDIVNMNGKTMQDYFISLKDLQGIDLLYKQEPTEKEINDFVGQIKLGHDGKIQLFIDMLSEDQYTQYENGNPNENNIFKGENKIKFKGYEDIDGLYVGQFWKANDNSTKIKERIKEQLNNVNITDEEKTKLQKAQRAIDCYAFVNKNNPAKRIDCFIEMLSEEKYTRYKESEQGCVGDENNIFKYRNQIRFKGYEYLDVDTSHFWYDNSEEIKKRINDLLNKPDITDEEKAKLDRAKRAIDCYEFIRPANIVRRIDCFIEMLSEEKYTRYKKSKKGYVPDDNNTFKKSNKIKFKGYENIEGLYIGQFWTANDNSTKIKERIKEQLNNVNITDEEKTKLQKAQRAIDFYEFVNPGNATRRIDCFIDMLSDKKYRQYKNGDPDDNNIFAHRNKVRFKDYEYIEGIDTSNFWLGHSTEIIERINELLNKNDITDEEKEKLAKAQRAIDCYEFSKKDNVAKRIDCFIEMLSEDKYTKYENCIQNENNIFNSRNKIPFKGYEDIEGIDTSNFWFKYSARIISLLFYNKQYDSQSKEFKDSEKDYTGPEYDKARMAILEYAKVKNIDEYIDKIKDEKKRNTLISLRENTRDLTMSEIDEAGKIIERIPRRNQRDNQRSRYEWM